MSSRRSSSAMSSSLTMKVNRSNRLSSNLQFWPVMKANHWIDLISGLEANVSSGSLVQEETIEGIAATTAADSRVTFEITHNIGAGPLSMICRYRPNILAGSWHTVMNLRDNLNYGMYVPRSSGSLFVAHDSSAGVVEWENSIVTQDQFDTYSMNCLEADTLPIHYRNGLLQTITDSGTTPDYNGNTAIEMFSGQGSEWARGTMAWAALWNRLLGKRDQYEIHRDPMQMFRRVRTVMWMPSASVAVSPYQYGAYWM